jgi:transcriptional antiterminator RfaH
MPAPINTYIFIGTLFLKMQTGYPAWYCARTKPKHEHLAAAHLRKNLNLEVFQPQLRIERATQRGVMRVLEPLFPCYVFVRCVLEEYLDEIQYSNGIHSLVHFGHRIPPVADSIVEELQECFGAEATMTVDDHISPGDEITIGEGAFAGMHAYVLRLMPARKRVQVLLEVLGGPTPVEVDRCSVVPVRNTLADLVPILAAPCPAFVTATLLR